MCAAGSARSTPAPPEVTSVNDPEEQQPKPKRKYSRRKSIAPTGEDAGTPAPAEPPKRKGRARSKAPAAAAALNIPDSHLPWVSNFKLISHTLGHILPPT